MGELLTTSQAATVCGRTEYTVRRWLVTGRLKGIKQGRTWLINKRDLATATQGDTLQATTADTTQSHIDFIIEQARHQSARLRELERQVDELRRDNDRLRARVSRLQIFGVGGAVGLLIEAATAETNGNSPPPGIALFGRAGRTQNH